MSETMVGMTIWTAEQTFAAMRLRAQVDVDLAYANDPEVSRATRRKLTQSVIALGHPLGLELDARDMTFAESEGDFATKTTCAWRPATLEVVLRRGLHDGERVTLTQWTERIVLPDLREPGDTMTPTLAGDHLFYDFAGWNEIERHWVFEVKP